MTTANRIEWAIAWSHIVLPAPGEIVSVVACATGPDGEQASASGETCFNDPTTYGVPANIPPEKIVRFSRIKARPTGQGGGSLVLKVCLEHLDRHGLWAVLENSPYPGFSKKVNGEFYAKHGFLQHPKCSPGALYRPPRSEP